CGRDRNVLLSDFVPHGKLVVCGGIPRILGLGTDVLVFRARQRDRGAWPSDAARFSRQRLAHWGKCWAGGQPGLLCGGRGGGRGLCATISWNRSWVRRDPRIETIDPRFAPKVRREPGELPFTDVASRLRAQECARHITATRSSALCRSQLFPRRVLW